MKILALGGAGQEGTRTVQDLVDSPQVTSVIIGDLNIEAANRLKQEIGSDKVSTIQVDATDGARLIEAMREVDVTVSFVGPYYRFGVPILRAAIAAGCNYVDICDDAEPTLEMLELHEDAAKAGIVAVIGSGVSPGTFNVMALDGANRLDQVDEIHFRWNVSSTDIEGDISESAATEHGIHIMNGDVTQFIDGEFVSVPAMSGSEQVCYPVLGETEAYFLGHPETVTIPRYIDGVKTVTQKGGCIGLDDIMRSFRELGLTSEEPLQVKGLSVRPCDVAVALLGRMPMPEDPSELPPAISEFILYVDGVRDGKRLHLTYVLSGKMGPLTGIPASITAQMIAAGQVSETGVFPPEGCLNPEIFLGELAQRNITYTLTETGV